MPSPSVFTCVAGRVGVLWGVHNPRWSRGVRTPLNRPRQSDASHGFEALRDVGATLGLEDPGTGKEVQEGSGGASAARLLKVHDTCRRRQGETGIGDALMVGRGVPVACG